MDIFLASSVNSFAWDHNSSLVSFNILSISDPCGAFNAASKPFACASFNASDFIAVPLLFSSLYLAQDKPRITPGMYFFTKGGISEEMSSCSDINI